MKFLTVRLVILMTHRECCVDHPFPYHVTRIGRELSPPPHRKWQWVTYFNWLFGSLLSVPWNAVTWTCDWLNWFSLIIIFPDFIIFPLQCYLELEWVAFSYQWYFSLAGCLLALVWLGLELLSSSLFLSRDSMRVALIFSPLALRWLPRLLSHWSSSWTVPLTPVLRISASAEQWLYWTRLPCLTVLRTIWSKRT
jgi:hypothetical protein